MILAIDVGNTNIVVGCIDDRKTYFIERLSTNRTKTELEYAVDLKNVLDIYHIKKTEIEGCIISSVVPQITNIVKLDVYKRQSQDKGGHTLREGLEKWHEKADGKCSCDYSFHMSCLLYTSSWC